MTSLTSQTLVSAPTRRGRPPASEAGVVEERVIDAATRLFLEQGFGRTTLDQVSQLSKTGKSTLYGRYADKHELFAAVVRRSIETMFAELPETPDGLDVKGRLRHVGLELAKSLMVPRCVALMRITAAEAANMPELAQMAYDVSFQGSVRCVLNALRGHTPPLMDASAIAGRFVELALHPVAFQAAFRTDFDILQAKYAADVEDAILLLETKGQLVF